MSQPYIVRQGDCIASLAARFQQSADDIWNAPENNALREKRRNSSTLVPGDVVYLPSSESTKSTLERGSSNRLQCQIERLTLDLQMSEVETFRNREFTVMIGSFRQQGTIDNHGVLRLSVPANAVEGELVVHLDSHEFRSRLAFGHLDPHDTVTGIQHRLTHLGYVCGPADGEWGPRTREAYQMFQRDRSIEPTHDPDADTSTALDRAFQEQDAS